MKKGHKIRYLSVFNSVLLGGRGRFRRREKFSPPSPQPLLRVFSVTPFRIDQNKNQIRSMDKVQNLGKERR